MKTGRREEGRDEALPSSMSRLKQRRKKISKEREQSILKDKQI
jgi:hypothetical protein